MQLGNMSMHLTEILHLNASRVIKQHPYHPQAFSKRADALQRLQRWEEAIDEYRRVGYTVAGVDNLRSGIIPSSGRGSNPRLYWWLLPSIRPERGSRIFLLNCHPEGPPCMKLHILL